MQILTSRETVNWLTPPHIIEMAREVLGDIDLDPASHPKAQEWIQAKEARNLDLTNFVIDSAWSKQDLKRELRKYSLSQMRQQPTWKGRVWLNPPFDATPEWMARWAKDCALGGVTQSIVLGNANTGYGWFTRLCRNYPVCITDDCLRFLKEDGTVGGKAKRGQVLAYFGPDVALFARVFSKLGRILPSDSQQVQFRRLQRLDWTAAMGIGGLSSPDVARNALVM
jgi:hypothetical protein